MLCCSLHFLYHCTALSCCAVLYLALLFASLHCTVSPCSILHCFVYSCAAPRRLWRSWKLFCGTFLTFAIRFYLILQMHHKSMIAFMSYHTRERQVGIYSVLIKFRAEAEFFKREELTTLQHLTQREVSSRKYFMFSASNVSMQLASSAFTAHPIPSDPISPWKLFLKQ